MGIGDNEMDRLREQLVQRTNERDTAAMRLANNRGLLDAALEREQALKAALEKMDSQVSECQFHGHDVATCLQYSGQAPCMSEREQALAAYMERLREDIYDQAVTIHGEFGVRETVEDYLPPSYNETPDVTTLARRDLIKQAEALKDIVSCGELLSNSDILDMARALRQQASAL